MILGGGGLEAGDAGNLVHRLPAGITASVVDSWSLARLSAWYICARASVVNRPAGGSVGCRDVVG